MKIAIIKSGMPQGGGERVATVLIDQFIKNGHEVILIISGDSNECAYQLNSELKIVYLKDWLDSNPIELSLSERIKKKINKTFTKQDEFEKMYRDYQNGGRRILSFLEANPVDYAIGLLVHDNMSLALCTKKQNAKIIIRESTYPDRPEYSDVFKQVRNKCYEHTDYHVFQTKEQEILFPKRSRKNGVVISNPVKENLPIRTRQGVGDNTIVNFCRMDRPKNLFLLLDSFSKIAEEYPDYQLKIYGDGPLHIQIKEYIAELSLQNKVFICPFDENLHEKIKDHAMFVTSSDYEGLSNSLMEAMAMGMPVIATDCLGGGAKSLIIDGDNGLLVPRGNKEQLYLAMKKYIDNPDFAEKCGKNASKVREEYSSERIAEKWLSIMK